MLCTELYLGIDVGTTSVKAAFTDEQGNGIAQFTQEYPTIHIKPLWVEQNPWDWWDAVKKAVRGLTASSPENADRVKAIAVSGQAPCCMGIDRNGVPVGNALIWMDRRAQDICDTMLHPYAEKIRNICSNRVDPYYALPKMLWHRENRRAEYDRISKYLQANSWIVFCMTGRSSIDRTHLNHLQLFNIFTNKWETEWAEKLGFDLDRVPRLYECSDKIGELTTKAAAELGLRPGIPVAAGCTDAAAVSLGLQYTEDGCMFEMSGQSSGIGLVVTGPVKSNRLNLSCGAVPGTWTLKGSMSTTGGAVKWFRDEIDHGGDENTYVEYDALVNASKPGANGVLFLPYLAGERAPLWDSTVSGMFFGLRTGTSKGDMIRAIYEGAAFGLCSIYNEFPRGLKKQGKLYGTGGGYKSEVWSQIKADVLGIPIEVRQADIDAACLGDAYLAMKMLRTEYRPRPAPDSKVYYPDPEKHLFYQKRFQTFIKLYQTNKSLFLQNRLDIEQC